MLVTQKSQKERGGDKKKQRKRRWRLPARYSCCCCSVSACQIYHTRRWHWGTVRPVLVFSVHTHTHTCMSSESFCGLRRKMSETGKTAEKTERESSLRVVVLSVAGFGSIAHKEETHWSSQKRSLADLDEFIRHSRLLSAVARSSREASD